jgi:hypothetical protein
MDYSTQDSLLPLRKRTIYKIRSQSFYSQNLTIYSPTPTQQVSSAPSYKKKKRPSESCLVSVGKKVKTESKEIPCYYIEVINLYTGKSFYHNFVHNLKLPKSSNPKLEPENTLTDEQLIEFSVNTIKSWIFDLVTQVNNL